MASHAGKGKSGKVTRRDQLQFNSVSSGIGGVLDHLKQELQVLNEEIKADEAGAFQYRNQLDKLRREKEELATNIAANEEWASMFDSKIGPFKALYDTLTGDITVLYEDAKEQHKHGLELLCEEFRYHPVYKRWSDDFSSTPFKPA